MGFEDEKFTWNRNRIRERLDRAVGNGGFHGYFLGAKIINAEHHKSDHRLLVLDTEGCDNIVFRCSNGVKPFEARWLKEENVQEIVQQAWERTGLNSDFASKTAAIHSELHHWDRTVLKEPQNKLKQLNKDLEELQKGPLTDRRDVKSVGCENLPRERPEWASHVLTSTIIHNEGFRFLGSEIQPLQHVLNVDDRRSRCRPGRVRHLLVRAILSKNRQGPVNHLVTRIGPRLLLPIRHGREPRWLGHQRDQGGAGGEVDGGEGSHRREKLSRALDRLNRQSERKP